jgi:hypothetical protein
MPERDEIFQKLPQFQWDKKSQQTLRKEKKNA